MQMRPVLCKWPASARLTINNNSGSPPPSPKSAGIAAAAPFSPHLIEYQRAELKNREIPNRNGQPLPNDIFPNEFPL